MPATPGGPVTSPTPPPAPPKQPPTQHGWYLFKCQDGTAGLAQYTGSWQGIPCSNPANWHFIAATIADIQKAPATIWDNVAKAMGFTACQMNLISRGLDVSSQGQGSSPPPLFADPKCSSPKGFTNKGDAQSAGINLPNPLSGIVGVFQAIFSVQFWKGAGLIIAGVLLLVFAALELKKMT